ncbi:MAG: response regulator transcription factor [Verrucomicrobiota bacterium]
MKTSVPGMSLRIALVDDHRMFRDGMRLVLQRENDCTIVGEASDARGARELLAQTVPDVLILDLQLPDGNGIEISRSVLADHPEVRILMVSGNPDLSHVGDALKAGILGYLLKDEPSEELLRAVRTVAGNRVYLCPAAATALAEDLKAPAPAPGGNGSKRKLSPQELQVLKLVAEGKRNKEIADHLQVSPKSVETYRYRLMAKLECSSTAELVRYAVREGILAA